jgi:hypothetical protein
MRPGNYRAFPLSSYLPPPPFYLGASEALGEDRPTGPWSPLLVTLARGRATIRIRHAAASVPSASGGPSRRTRRTGRAVRGSLLTLVCVLLLAASGPSPQNDPHGTTSRPPAGAWEIHVQVDPQGTRVEVQGRDTSLSNPQGEIILKPGEAGVGVPGQAPRKFTPPESSPDSPSPAPAP